jgi:general secretion pathway protein I
VKVAPPTGFTLIEVLVALAIVAVAMMAGIKASGALADHSERQVLALLGQICSDNELISLRLSRRLPDVGVRDVECQQAAQVLQMKVAVQATPNPGLRRVRVRVLQRQQVVFEVTGIVGGSSP